MELNVSYRLAKFPGLSLPDIVKFVVNLMCFVEGNDVVRCENARCE